jgi:CTP synthase
VFSGIHDALDLVEMIELKDHPYFLATQFHPEFQSKPMRAHPVFRGLVAAAERYRVLFDGASRE